MGLTIADTYYLKAKEAVDYDWGEACESLNYALSYEENHAATLCLLGRIYARNLNDFTSAFNCFDKVIATNCNYIDVYPKYAKYLIWANEIKKANKLIQFGLGIKGIEKSKLLCLSSYAAETNKEYKKALKKLKKAKRHAYNNSYVDYINNEEKRIKKKIKLDKVKKKNIKA